MDPQPKYRDRINILGRDIPRGASLTLHIDVAALHTRSSLQTPVFVERAREDGPVLLLMAGVHGDELNGIDIVRRIVYAGDHKPTRGTVVCIPVLNIFGFVNLARKFPDGRDLNRVFPGSKNGSLASRVRLPVPHAGPARHRLRHRLPHRRRRPRQYPPDALRHQRPQQLQFSAGL